MSFGQENAIYTANGLFFYFDNSITIYQTAQSGQADVNILTVCSLYVISRNLFHVHSDFVKC